jgi:NAD(P)H-dependent flavin oxidoreductase YrpB (nitropropane dioxygenase family)
MQGPPAAPKYLHRAQTNGPKLNRNTASNPSWKLMKINSRKLPNPGKKQFDGTRNMSGSMPIAGRGFLRHLGIQHPIIQAPMAGGATTPELVAAVSNAGGLGSLGAAYLTPDQIASDIRAIRALTGKPFNVNLFAGGYTPESRVDAGPMLELLAEIHHTHGLPAPTLPAWAPNLFDQQLDIILQARPAIFSFAFGIPDADAMARLKARGIATVGTATTVEEGRRLAAAGVTAIAAQGSKAGGHRGTLPGPLKLPWFPLSNWCELSRQPSPFRFSHPAA